MLPVFMKAGKHAYVVRTPQETYIHKLLFSPFREEDIPISKHSKIIGIDIKSSKFKKFTRVFKKDTSVFKDWKEDTE